VRHVLASAPLLGVAVLAACNPTPSATIQLTTGGETDTFTRPPAPTTLRVDAVDAQGNVTNLATASLPTDRIDLGTHDQTDVATLEVTGTDANGNRLVFGASVPLEYGALDGLTLPLFVQRTGELARMPGPLSDARQAPVLSQVQGQYLFVGGGSDPSLATTTQLYDFSQFQPLSAPPSLPRAPWSVAFVGTVAMLVDANGGSYFDLSQNASHDIPPPAGGSFAEIAGGQTVVADDGTTYVVGATRSTGTPTDAVLVIDPSDTSNGTYPVGNLSWAKLTAPRLGASAAWVKGRGLVVAGGSTTAAGAELLAEKTTSGSALPYLPDPSVGSGAIALDQQHVLLAGGLTPDMKDAGVRAIDLGCASMCAPMAWSALPVPVGAAQVFAIDPADAFMVGSEPSGPSHAYRLTSTSATEIPFKVPRRNARAAVSPVGSIVVVGGANEIESFWP
jgi:hypothetical protein